MKLTRWRWGKRPVRSRGIAVVFAALAAIVLGVIPAGAQAVAARTPPAGHASGRFTVGQISATATGLQTSAKIVCTLPKGWDNRTQACALDGATAYVKNSKGKVIGYTSFVLTQAMQLNPRSRSFSEVITVAKVFTEGENPVWEMNLFVSCGNSCAVTNDWPQGSPVEQGTKGTISYTVAVGKNQSHSLDPSYQLTLVASNVSPIVFTWNFPVSIRCDDLLSQGFAVAGCVFPSVTPTLTVSRANFGASAAMIQWAQQHLSAHWGLRGRGKPLTRLANTTQRNTNRTIICERAWRPYGPWVAGKVKVSDSCDEFPFASTWQSGAMKNGKTDNSFSGAECAQVEAVKTADSGSVARIWNAIKVIGTYRASARCVRGHIPLPLNRDVGNLAWKAFIAAERLLDKDPFWVAVAA